MIDEHIQKQMNLMNAVRANFENEESLKKMLIVTALAMIDEVLEVVEFEKDSTKPWKSSNFNTLQIKEEIIDIYHFMLQFFALLGMNHNEIDTMYRWKNQMNFERIKGKMNAITN